MQEQDHTVRVVTAIAAAPHRVWEVLTDLPSYRHWHPNMEFLGDTEQPLAVGSVVRLRTNAGTAAALEFDVTVTDLDEPNVLAWEGGDPELFHGHHRFSLIADGEHTTLVNEEFFTGSMAAAVLAQNRAAVEAQYATGDAALRDVAQTTADRRLSEDR